MNHRGVRARRVRCFVFGVVMATAALAQVRAALAEPTKVEQASALKAEGDALMESYQYAEALEKYQAAFALSGDPALLFNQGRALELMARYPEALRMLRDFDARASPELHERVGNLPTLIASIEAKTCEIEVKVTAMGAPVDGATVNLGKEVLGVSPLAVTRVNAREVARVEVTLEGFEPFNKEIELPSKGHVVVAVELVPKDKRATLHVDSPVKGASVFVDDASIGQVPTEVKVQPGPHKVRLVATGYTDNEVEVDLKQAERRNLVIEPGARPVYEQWWFWTITGGVVVAGGVSLLAWALLTEADPDQGSIPPCTVPVSVSVQAEDCPGAIGNATHARVGMRSPFWGARALDRIPLQIGPVPVFTLRF
ncbi:MAG: PEGA domain-containing protein [Polyangiaceae bacterium]